MRNFAKTGCRLLYSLRVLLVIYFISMTDVGLRAAASDVPVTISGSVVDSAGEPVIGATVMADGMQGGTATDAYGRFTLAVNLPAKITVSFIGMQPESVNVAEGGTLPAIVLYENSVVMDEVVVVGYGQQKKATVTGAISQVQTKELLQSSQANISNALVGHMSGLLAVQRSGEPGNDQSTLRIRGVGTFASGGDTDLSAPLVMVDGIESPNYNSIDPNEIENISILKDASATAVYGVRGSNGVILITTKRGQNQRPKVSFSTNFAIGSFTNLREQMNAYDYALAFNESRLYDGYLTGNYEPRYSEEDIRLYKDHSDPIFHPDTDWIDMIFKKHTLQTQHNVNITGGTDRVRYFASVGAFTQDGMYNHTDLIDGMDAQVRYNRFNFRTNFDFNVTPYLDIKLNVSDQLENHRAPAHNAEYILANAFAHPPTSGPGIINGMIIDNLDGEYNFVSNPMQILLIHNGATRTYRNQLNLSTRFDLNLDRWAKGLGAHLTISYQNFSSHIVRVTKEAPTYMAKGTKENPVFLPQGRDGAISTAESTGKNRKTYLEGGVDYNRRFGSHEISVLALYNQSKYHDPALAYLVPNAYQGFVGRFTYNYDNRYLVEFNAGYNGTENFRAGKRFGFFPAYSLGWVASSESFFPHNPWITFLKIRGSYGEVGNDKIGGERFLYRPTSYVYNDVEDNVAYAYVNNQYFFGTVGSNYTFYRTSSEGKLGNPDLTWERARKANAGFDIHLWNDKVHLTADWFHESRNDILTNRSSVPVIVGASMPAYNLGRMVNWGFDGEINWFDRAGNVNYWVKATFTFARNRIRYMDEAEKRYAYQASTGQRYHQCFGLIAEGFYNTWAEVNDPNRPVSMWNNNRIQPGDVKYKDVNGDGVIDSYDFVPIGYSDFPEISYGISFGGNWKGFDVSVLFQGASHVSFNASKKSKRGFMEDGSAVSYLKDYSWTPERYESGADIKFPHLSADAAQTHNYQNSTLWIRDAAYLRLKNVEIGYTLPAHIMRKIGLQSTRIYINGTNLATWSGLFPGEDPEIPTYSDSDYEPYPIMKTVNFGLSLSF